MNSKINKKWLLIICGILLAIVFVLFGCSSCIKRGAIREEAFLKTSEDAKKFAEVKQDGKTPAVLLLHGFCGSPYDYAPLIAELEKNGIAFEAVLMHGHGTSPLNMEDVKYTQWLEKAYSSFDNMKQKYGKVTIVGFSMGGAMATCLAADKDVEKILLIAPYYRVTSKWYYFGPVEEWNSRLSGIIPWVKKPLIGQINDPEGLKRYFAYRRFPTSSVLELDKLGKLAMEKAKDVRCEVLVLHSAGDIAADLGTCEKVVATMPSEKKQIIEYTKSNHVIFYDYDSKDAVRKSMEYLTKGVK